MRLTGRYARTFNEAMRRREFLTRMLAGLAVAKLSTTRAEESSSPYIERPRTGLPHTGKVLLAIQPHSDDVALICAGTVAKLVQEGYTGYMVRATNDDMGDDVGEPGTVGENVLRNEREVSEQARVLGLKRDFALNYGNHRMSRHFTKRTDLPVDFPDSSAKSRHGILLRSLGARRGKP